ncbi:hypothetical protein B0J13DRAFT_558469 [Dactylonectria estremocensis]|uniref:Uncharacterized protein n=1 Tax=Dactylonectria estremocensis TaxID=1079267 RepID=A0A9P9J2K0_9HYPO|nr:hypothetical protein B0J13DRAFT_558469 [Dactylonectria estremocensis]
MFGFGKAKSDGQLPGNTSPGSSAHRRNLPKLLLRVAVVFVLIYFLLFLSNAKALESTPDVPVQQPGQHKAAESNAPPKKSKPVAQTEESKQHGQAEKTRTTHAIVSTSKAVPVQQSEKTKQPEHPEHLEHLEHPEQPEQPEQPIPPVHTKAPEQPPKQPPKQTEIIKSGNGEHSGSPGNKNQRLVVLLPATGPNPDLCKFLFSAMVLGYPTPIVLNWGVDYHEITKSPNGWNMPKIVGITKYLDAALDPEAHPDEKLHEDDIVLIADGYDVWFQLPPDVLLKRYHESNARANARLREQWPYSSPMPMRQTIIGASEKNCFPPPDAGVKMRCDILPESPLRPDLYGPDTDNNHNSTDFHTVRPRFINGGSYMGPAGDLRRHFRRVLFKFESSVGRGERLWSEQGMSGEVLGEQESWRKWRRKYDDSGDDANDADAMSLMQREYEYHFGLDYHQEISIPTVHAEKDGWIIHLNNKADIAARSEKLGISPVRLQGVPADVKVAPNPLKAIADSPDWGEMGLYADFFTEAVPVLLHHNAWINDLKNRRSWWWKDMWYFKYLRQLVTLRMTPKDLTPLAEVKVESGNITYWAQPLDNVRRRPRYFRGSLAQPMTEMEYDTVCRFEEPPEDKSGPQTWWDEVFRDGKGGI